MAILVAVVLAFSIAFALRWTGARIFGGWFRQGIMWDAALHFAVIRTLRESNGPYRGVPQFLMALEPDAYPIAFHRFAALFSLGTLQKFPWLPNAIIQSVSFCAFVGFAHYLNDKFLHYPGWIFESATGALALLSVGNTVFSGNSILYLSLSERQLAKLATAWYFFGLR